ncbi:MAG: MoaD/ThiS family protein [Proteobacteria bacterium]|nr:MoaD/ThiS family protein [Pseudomonadota bacterium]
MNITLKLFASLGTFLPPGAARNAIELDVKNGATIGDVLTQHCVPREICHLILVNGIFAPPAIADSKQLIEGDTLAVWPPVAGG